MKKNFKKYLSYVLSIVLAMGLGLSYAYAVGANDSNAFVTTTEWEAKIAQIETSLDNINKTINDTNMDFMMNGPRLQAGLVEGHENFGPINTDGFIHAYRDTTIATPWNRYAAFNRVALRDNWNGTQSFINYGHTTSSLSSTEYPLTRRFAMKVGGAASTIYLIVSMYYYVHLLQFTWVDISKPVQDYSQAKTIDLAIQRNEWIKIVEAQNQPTEMARTNSGVYTGTAASDTVFPTTLEYTGGNTGKSRYNLSNPSTGWVSRSVYADSIHMRWEFPANCCIIRHEQGTYNNAIWQYIPRNMNGRKFGNFSDIIAITTSATTYGSIARVYSPQKGCYALKSYINGEIPILNE